MAATKKRGYETLRDMFLSLGVIVAGVLVFVAVQPKNHTHPVPAVDYARQVQLLARQAPYPVLAPGALPAGFAVNYTRIGTAGASELHMGFVIDLKRFAQLDETDQPGNTFYADAKVPPTADGTVQAGGATYEVRRSQDGGTRHVALVRTLPSGAVVTVSDGGTDGGAATFDDLVRLAGALQVTPTR